jgi:hypothetical protein
LQRRQWDWIYQFPGLQSPPLDNGTSRPLDHHHLPSSLLSSSPPPQSMLTSPTLRTRHRNTPLQNPPKNQESLYRRFNWTEPLADDLKGTTSSQIYFETARNFPLSLSPAPSRFGCVQSAKP